jgi:hypothetical protein
MTSFDESCFRLVRIALATLLAVFLLAHAGAAHAGCGSGATRALATAEPAS